MKKSNHEVMVGIFVVIGFLVLSVLVFFVSGVNFFKSGYKFNVMYDYVSILDKGAPVRMAGVRIGEVSAVNLIDDRESGKKRVQVKLFVENEVEIRENYLFKIQGTHILSEPHIEISPQPGDSPKVQEGMTLEGTSPVAVENLIDRAHSIVDNLDEIFQGIKESVQDPENGAAFKSILMNLEKLTRSLQIALNGSEEELKQAIFNIEASSDSLKNLLDQMEKGDGTVQKLFTEDELYEEIREFVAEIKARPWRLMKRDKGK